MTEYEFLITEKKNGVGYIGLNRYEARNALNYGLLGELVQAARAYDEDPEVGVIVMHSCLDKIFCAGADIKERRVMTDEQVVQRRIFARDSYDALEHLNKPLIAAINGKCMGGGCEIMGACDIILTSELSTFRYVEVAVGSVGATQRVTRFVGRQHANELLFTGRTIGTDEAYNMGLAARILPSENFMEHVAEAAEMIASHPRVTLLATKKAIKVAASAPPEIGVMYELMAIDYNLAKNDWRGSLDSFKQQTKEARESGKG